MDNNMVVKTSIPDNTDKNDWLSLGVGEIIDKA